MRKSNQLSLLLAFALSASAHADTLTNNCKEFYVQVLNSTGSECIFQNYRMQQGTLFDTYPNITVLGSNETQTFQVRQDLIFGPTITLNYLCNGKKISIQSHQNFCYLASGNIEGTIVSADPGITAAFTTREGSFNWSMSGNIYWALKDKV